MRLVAELNPDAGLESDDVFVGGVNAAAFDPTGRMLATGGDTGVVRVWDVTTGSQLCVDMEHPDEIVTVGWARDGGLVSVDLSGRIVSRDPNTSAVPREVAYPELGDAVCTAAVSPDGARLAMGSDTVDVFDLGSGGSIARLDGFRDWLTLLGWSPDSRRLIAHGRENPGIVWDGGSELDLGSRIRMSAWSPDSSSVVGVCWDDYVRVWDARTGEVRAAWVPDVHADFVSYVGEEIVLAGEPGCWLVDPAAPTNGRTVPLPSLDNLAVLEPSHDGRRLMGLDVAEDCIVVDLVALAVTGRFPIPGSGPWCAVWSPDDRQIAVAGADGGVVVWT